MSRDQRASFRFSLPKGQDRAILRVGWRNFSARVLNASASGFLIACPLLEISRGEVLWLRTTAAWTEIRVVFVEHGDEETRLGVERIRELEEALPETSAWSPFGGPESGGIVANVGNLVVAIGVLAVIVAGAVFLHHQWNRDPGSRPTGSWGRSLSSLQRDIERACSDTAAAIKQILPPISFTSGNSSQDASFASDITTRLPDLVPASTSSTPNDLATSLGLDESPQRELGDLWSSARGNVNQRLTTPNQKTSKNLQLDKRPPVPAPPAHP
jgi:hypothetical protein